MKNLLAFEPDTRIRLSDVDAAFDSGTAKERASAEIKENVAEIGGLAHRLYAENNRAVLIILQGMDTSGKDGAIRTVIDGVNPQSCQIVSFKQPSQEELDHDFLWRIHKEVPRRGMVGIFNRSHYEDVLIVRVHQLVSEDEWRRRYDRINEFERQLVEGGTTLVKFYLHISKGEQKERLQARLDDPHKRWKFNVGDLAERKRWGEYMSAYEDALSLCNTRHAPWHIVPADRKWHRNLIISRVLRQTLARMDPQFPPADPSLEGIRVE